MADFENNNVAIMGDWLPPTPSPRTFLSGMLSNAICSPPTAETTGHDEPGELFLGSDGQLESKNSVLKNEVPDNISSDRLTLSSSFFEQKSTLRGGLVERIAARSGLNAPRLDTETVRSTDHPAGSEFVMIPPGLSPTMLLDSPLFLSNPLALPSPTTGRFPFLTSCDGKNLVLEMAADDKSQDNFFDDGLVLVSEAHGRNKGDPFEDLQSEAFSFKPRTEFGSSPFVTASSKVATLTLPQKTFPSIGFSSKPENSLQPHAAEQTKVSIHDRGSLQMQAGFSRLCEEKENGMGTISTDRPFDPVGTHAQHSPPADDQPDEGELRSNGDSMAPAEDGYNWRKYGQKQVKGSEYPRSYYKCTHPNCQVKKKVERSLEGHITEIIYKGSHNHPKPAPNRRSVISSSNPLVDMHPDINDQALQQSGDGGLLMARAQQGTVAGLPDGRGDSREVTSSASVCLDYYLQSISLQAQNGPQFQSGEAVDGSSTFSNDDDGDDWGTLGSLSPGNEGEEDESESKRRKLDASISEMSGATRAIREPRVVVQTTSEVDILDDGYRWRKYGQKVVKGNPNPRSYYKCTSVGCTVRKHVERASHDVKSVITTYEGKHNHDVPVSRSSNSHGASGSASAQAPAAVTQTRVEKSHSQCSMVGFESTSPLGLFSIAGRQQLGPQGYPFGLDHPGFAGAAMAALGGPDQVKPPLLPLHPYLARQGGWNQMGLMMPKGEPKLEAVVEPGLNLSNGPSMYKHVMSRLPLGPHL